MAEQSWSLGQEWQEEAYLEANADVRNAVQAGVIPDGFYHWITFGQFEGRPGSSLRRSETGQTRSCLDPWKNVEFMTNGRVKPCCKFNGAADLADHGSLEDLRRSDTYQELRLGLLTGNLHPVCQTCHIRKMVPIKEQVQQVFRLLGPGVSLVEPGPLLTARVDMTGKCNLRCVYCAVSQPWYDGPQMPDEDLEQVADQLAGYPSLTAVDVNGHGETTQHPRWKAFCRRLLAKDIPLTIITNLGRKYDEDDFDVLSRFKVVQISVDTADDNLLRAVRRKVELSRIVYNLTRIRTTALVDGRKPPLMSFSCGIYDRSVLRLEEFAWFAVTLGVPSITFWNLVQYPDVPGATAVRPLSTLDDTELAAAMACIDRALAVLERYKIQVEIAGGFIEELRARLNGSAVAAGCEIGAN